MLALIYLSMLASVYGVVFNLTAMLRFLRVRFVRKHATRSAVAPRRA